MFVISSQVNNIHMLSGCYLYVFGLNRKLVITAVYLKVTGVSPNLHLDYLLLDEQRRLGAHAITFTHVFNIFFGWAFTCPVVLFNLKVTLDI